MNFGAGLSLLLVSLVFWMLAFHPFITYPISLLIFSGRLRNVPVQNATSAHPTISICTCAYNESKIIEMKIKNLLALKERYPAVEILIYVDAASDGTQEIVSNYQGQISLILGETRQGKTHGMNRLVAESSGEIVVFTDANVMLDLNSLARIAAHFSVPDVGCICGNLIYTNSSSSTTASTGSMYWRLEQFIKQRESIEGAVMGADGSLFAVRRSLHRPPPDDIIDDMYVSFQVLCQGARVIQVDDVVAYEESVTAAREEYRRKIRIACQAFNVHRLIWKDIRAAFSSWQIYMYVSHKFLRWLSFYFMVLGGTALLAGLIFIGQWRFAAGLGVGSVAGIWIGSRWRIPVLSPAINVLSALAGTSIGVWSSMRGERYQTWQPALSIRA